MKQNIFSKTLNHLDYLLNESLVHHTNWFTCFLLDRIYNLQINETVRIPESTHFVHHGHGTEIANDVFVGENTLIYNNVIIGIKDNMTPRIGNNIIIYPHCIIIGGISIGDNSIIGAGTFVNKNIKPNSVVYNPTKLIIKRR